MIYIHECRLCGCSSLAANALKHLQICGDCFVDPRNPFSIDWGEYVSMREEE